MSSTKIYQAIPKLMAEVGSIAKGRQNKQQGYVFRGIDDVYSALQAPLAKHGVFFAPKVLEQHREERAAKSGGVLIYTILKVEFVFFADDGSSFSVTTIGEGMDSGDKSANKAMSAALKYALLQLFCVPTDEPKDSENDSPEPTPKKGADIRPISGHGSGRASSEGSGAFCQACSAELLISKSGAGYYCPNFKDTSVGEHTRIKAVELAAFKQHQELNNQQDVPF